MARAAGILGAALLSALGVAALWWFWPGAPLAARFDPGDCRRLALIDAATGRAIIGIEDIARVGDALYLSAYDRAAAEAALAAGNRPPGGALYRLGLDALARPGPLALAPLLERGNPEAVRHPHGLDARGGRLLVIDHRLDPAEAQTGALLLYAIGADGLVLSDRRSAPALCPANDLIIAGGRAYVTLDRADCPGLSARDALFPAGRGRLVAVALEGGRLGPIAPERDGLTHPNGVLAARIAGQERIVVAETRAGRLAWPGGSVPTPGAPDNLTGGPAGGIVAALHPSLFRLALYRYGWTGRAPSRAARIHPATGATEILFDDPRGRWFSAATVAVLTGRRLILGSVRDAGLLICEVAA